MKKPFGRKSKDVEVSKQDETIPRERSLVDVDYNRKKLSWSCRKGGQSGQQGPMIKGPEGPAGDW